MDTPEVLRQRFQEALHPENRYRGRNSSSSLFSVLILLILVGLIGVLICTRFMPMMNVPKMNTKPVEPNTNLIGDDDPLFQPFEED